MYNFNIKLLKIKGNSQNRPKRKGSELTDPYNIYIRLDDKLNLHLHYN